MSIVPERGGYNAAWLPMSWLARGTKLGPYEVDALLGRGGMGEVYRAVDRRLGRAVAVKILSGERGIDEARRRRFAREAQVVSGLSHPHICTLYDVGEHEGGPYLVMEHLEGETLEAQLARGPIAPDETVRIATQCADALAFAHGRGIVHRDLKPGNIMLTAEGVKVLDFGLAKPWLAAVWPGVPDSGDGATCGISDSLTLDGTLLGTPAYMSPEQLRDEDVTASADIFAFGAVLFEMVTGRPAFTGRTPAEIIAGVLGDARPSVAAAAPHVPPGLDRIVNRCLAREPDDRFASMRDVLEALRRLPARPAAMDRPAPGTPAARLPRRALRAAAGLAGAAVAWGAFHWLPGGEAARFVSVAVVPFANESGEAALDPLLDGVALDVIDRLADLPRVRVTNWASVVAVRDAVADPRAVVASLGVDWLITGRVTAAGDGFSLAVEYFGTADDQRRPLIQHTWPRGDSQPVLPRVIAQAVVDMLAVPMTAEAGTRLARQLTDSAEANDRYWQGRSCLARRDLACALTSFTGALDADPRFAGAAAGLASTWALMGTMGWDVRPPTDAVPRAKTWVERALELDPALAEAHATRAFVLRFQHRRAEAGEAHLQSVALSESCAACFQWLASHLWTLGRFNEARAHLEHARGIDPNSAVIQLNLGRHYYYQRDYVLAIRQFERALGIDPDFWLARQLIILSLVQQGRVSEARVEFGQLRGAQDKNRRVLDAYLLAAEGRRQEALDGIAGLRALAQSTYVPVYLFAVIYAELGEVDLAMAALREAEAEGSGYLDYLGLDPTLDPIRRHPAYGELLQRMNLEDHSAQGGSRGRPAA
jgi:tetratricopeptide (TPR) repeat protein